MVKMSIAPPGRSLFDRVGGRPYFDALVADFYARIEGDPVVRPLYPDDLTDSIVHTAGFLAQFWGGGTVQYSDHRGHPRLRARHLHVEIGQAERDHWLEHMLAAVAASGAPADARAEMVEYFEMASTHMINVDR